MAIAQGIRLQTTFNGVPLTITAYTILTAFGLDIYAASRDLAIMFAVMLFLTVVIGLLVVYKITEKR